MANFTWGISQLEREISDGYVYTAHYTVVAEDEGYTASSYGSVGLRRPEGELIPYENLTEETVIGWVQEALGGQKQQIERNLVDQLEEAKTPTKASGIPWISS